ncbi:MAG: DUF2779 domain-containing protein [Myxococcota bacterium]
MKFKCAEGGTGETTLLPLLLPACGSRLGGVHRLSKSRFVSGLQCHRKLWWQVHEPDAPELVPSPQLEVVFERGHVVGDLARTYFPGGVLIDLPHHDVGGRVAATRKALDEGATVIYEASFLAADVFVAVDILSREADGWVITEVKSTASVKDQHIPDAAIQTHVVRRSGLDAIRVEVMHLNRGCRHPDLSNLFFRANVTALVDDRLPAIPGEISGQIEMLDGPIPEVAVGPHCTDPYDCPFMTRCWPVQQPHHVSTLYRIGRRVDDLLARGYVTIDQIPDDFRLKPPAARQRRAVITGDVVVEPGLGSALSTLAPPIAFLDFETVSLPIPIWPGCRPFDNVPVQFSCHVDLGGDLLHREWLASGSGDPREALARALIDATRESLIIVAYHATFERGCIRDLAEALPHLAVELHDIASRLWDLLPVVRDHVYHPDFGGGFGLKSVLPALVPDLAYDGLVIADGQTASYELERLLLAGSGMSPEERDRLRADLLRYCEMDTLAMVRLVERLRGLATERGS